MKLTMIIHLSAKYFTWYVCVGGGGGVPPSRHSQGTGYRVAGVAEAVYFYILVSFEVME